MITMQIQNIEQVQRAFAKAPVYFIHNFDIAIKKSVLYIKGSSMKETPVKTGRLRGSYREKHKTLYGETYPYTEYAMKVHRRNPYLQRGVDNSQIFVTQELETALNNTIKKIASEAK